MSYEAPTVRSLGSVAELTQGVPDTAPVVSIIVTTTPVNDVA